MARPLKIRDINCDEQLNIVLPLILKARFSEMLSYEKDMLRKRDTESVHNMRVAARRVQAILKIYHAFCTEELYIKNYRKLKSIINALGEVRQLDVYIDTIKEYNSGIKGKDKKAVNRLLSKQNLIRRQKRKLLEELIKKLNKKNYTEKFAQLYN